MTVGGLDSDCRETITSRCAYKQVCGGSHLLSEHPDTVIDRASPIPYYFQLAELLEQEIMSGRLPPGARLVSEPELGERYGLSRTTVRQALARLEQRGREHERRRETTACYPQQPGIDLPVEMAGDELGEAGRRERRVGAGEAAGRYGRIDVCQLGSHGRPPDPKRCL